MRLRRHRCLPSQVARVEEPFQRTSQKTLFRRLSWSPDGQFLCCPHAFKKPVNIAVVLRRPASGSEWAEECDFVGHEDPVGCVAFNPCTFRRDAPVGSGNGSSGDAASGQSHSAPFTCCALGGQDCTISIWVTAKPKPLVVVRKIFEQDVLDVAWAPDGYTLLAVSMDGTLAAICLEQSEIGTPISADEQRASLTRLYGDSLHAPPSAMLVESTALLALEQQRDAAAAAAAASAATATAAAAAASGACAVLGAPGSMPDAADKGLDAPSLPPS